MGVIRPEKRGMTCRELKEDGTPCLKVAMYYAGDDGFCFAHKAAAIAATEKEKRKHTSRRSVEEYHGRISAVGAISDGAQRNGPIGFDPYGYAGKPGSSHSKKQEQNHLDKFN